MPVGDNISALADWVELRVASRSQPLALAQIDRLLRAEGSELADEELDDEDAPFSGDDVDVSLPSEKAAAADVDVRVEQIRNEIGQRARIGQKLYPFTVDSGQVAPREVCGADVYLLLLVLGCDELPYRPAKRAHEVEETYDLIAMAALKRYLGRGAQGVRFARTAASADEDDEDPDRRPKNFPKAIQWLRQRLDLGPGVRPPGDDEEIDTQQHWEDEDETPETLGRPLLTSYNDAGVDVVVWWKFVDKRAGFPVLLAQCTVQIAWERKLNDISQTMWQKWIDFDTVPPQTALVIPFADRRDSPLWRDRTSEAGIILDRIRLIELLDELECETLEALIDGDVRAWTSAELKAA